MRTACKFAVAVLAALLFSLSSSAAVSYGSPGYRVTVIRPGGDRTCTLFQLEGVTRADDSLVPGTSWFSIADTMPEYKEMVATLLLPKATDRPITVDTSGTIPSACGHVGVAVIALL